MNEVRPVWLTGASRIRHWGIPIWELVCVYENGERDVRTWVWYCDN